jgi:hypothetical protein
MRMRALSALILTGLLTGLSASAAESSPETAVQAVFTELRALQPMQSSQSYTVRVGAGSETGRKERFLRRRTAAEVRASGLSCGCGDYALVFIEQIEARGFTTLLVDGAEISSNSLQNHFSGHAVVAIRTKDTPPDATWWLVDSTNLKILSRNWTQAETSFRAADSVYWIGYCGPRVNYPVRGPNDLKAFYTRTLAAVPPEFYNRTLSRFKFTIDPSFLGPAGEFLNPRLEPFLRMQEEIFTTYHIEPQREVAILLTRGDEGSASELTHTEAEGWVARVGLRSACSPTLLAHFEQTVARRK